MERGSLESLVLPDPIEPDDTDPRREKVRLGQGVSDPAPVLALDHQADQVELPRVLMMGQHMLVVLLLSGLRGRVGWKRLAVSQDPSDLRVLPAGQGPQEVSLDQLTLAGDVACPQCGKDALYGQHAGEIGRVLRRSEDGAFPVLKPPVLVFENAGLGHGQPVIGDDVGERASGPVARYGQVHQTGIDPRYRWIVDSQPLRFGTAQALDQYIRRCDQSLTAPLAPPSSRGQARCSAFLD